MRHVGCFVLLASLVGLSGSRAADSSDGVTILQLESNVPGDCRIGIPDAVHTFWRYSETWQPEVFKLDTGGVFRADVIMPVVAKRDTKRQLVRDADGKRVFELNPAPEGQGSPWPPAAWREPDFDDHAWIRNEGPMAEVWHGVALICVRGKFTVDNPVKVSGLSLSVGFRGGIVAYLNGKEIGRAFLPAGKLTPETLAEEYPEEAYVGPAGTLILELSPGGADYSSYVYTRDYAGMVPTNTYGFALKDRELLARFQKRYRRLEIQVPASALRKGVNVLALEVHRAPAREIMMRAIANDKKLANGLAAGFCEQQKFMGKSGLGGPGFWWNHAMLENIRLSAPAGAIGIVPNRARPAGFQVWQESVFKRVMPTQYGDPNEPVGTIRMRGVRNGICSAELVAGSRSAIRGLRAVASDLRGSGGTIPAAAVQAGYARWTCCDGRPSSRWQYDALDPDPPANIKPMTRSPWNANVSMAAQAGAVQPIWLTVQVPKGAKAGTYTGTVTVGAEGEKSVIVPLELRVIGDWVCPDPDRFTTYVGLIESPDSVAKQYGVPLWSESHWKLLDRVFALLRQLGNRELYVPLITRTMLGNEQSMVRWIKKADDTYQPDFSVVEKYLDLAVRHRWNVASACLAVSDAGIGQALWYSGKPRNPPSVTTLDPATRTVAEMPAPAWGTPESRTFWRPAIEGVRERLANRGMAQAMMYGFVVQGQVLPETIGDLNAILPGIRWWEYTHWGQKRVGNATNGADVGRMGWAFGTPLAVFWNPDEGKPHYAWRNLAKDIYFVAAPRAKGQINVSENGELSIFRLFSESTLLGSEAGLIPAFGAFRGFGEMGADFWPVQIASGDKTRSRMHDRYVNWGSLDLTCTLESLLGAGRNEPAHTCRSQLLHESLQEAEARVLVQNALLDPTQRARLGSKLAARCEKICDDRTRALNFCSVFFGENGMDYGRVFSQELWDAQTEDLYRAAGEVAAALGN
jgi:hypothetical protein